MNIEDYEKEAAEHKITFSNFIEDLRAKLADLMASEASSLQRMLDNYEEEENNIKGKHQVTQGSAKPLLVRPSSSGHASGGSRLYAVAGRWSREDYKHTRVGFSSSPTK